MQDIENIPVVFCQQLQGVFFDIDDTITTDGKLLDCSYQALWDCYRAGLKLVAITGRPAGWVDHIARMWPVHAVIGENGAFYFYMQDGKMHRYFLQSEETRLNNRIRLQKLRDIILSSVPGVQVSADQLYRESDLAIDFCEDVPAVPREKVIEVANIFHSFGAKAKISSIHVNGWFGDFDKLSTCKLFLQQLWKESPNDGFSNYIFCGDSPNDEPMFAEFFHSVGVANILSWLDCMKFHPTYVTKNKNAAGFAEIIRVVLQKRKF